jgi:hypothetical protein
MTWSQDRALERPVSGRGLSSIEKVPSTDAREARFQVLPKVLPFDDGLEAKRFLGS